MLQVLQIGWVHHPTYSVVRPPTMSHQVCSPLLLNRTNGSNIWCWAPRPHIHAASRNAHASWYLATAGGQDLKGRPIPSATESWSIIPGLIWVVKKTMVIISPRGDPNHVSKSWEPILQVSDWVIRGLSSWLANLPSQEIAGFMIRAY